MNSTQILLVLGRVLLGGLFVIGGLKHFFSARAIVLQMMTARGVPMPRLVLDAGSTFQIAAGLLLMSGYFTAPAAFGLIVFTVAASVMLLNYWDMEGPARDGCVNNWFSNIGIIGGLLIAAAQGF
jgi:putative oxidoreductase